MAILKTACWYTVYPAWPLFRQAKPPVPAAPRLIQIVSNTGIFPINKKTAVATVIQK